MHARRIDYLVYYQLEDFMLEIKKKSVILIKQELNFVFGMYIEHRAKLFTECYKYTF